MSLDCSSYGLEQINVAGCESLNVLNISNNNLLRFDAENLASLQELICDTRTVYMQSIGQIFALGEHLSAASSVKVKSASVSDNVRNFKAFDAAGNEIATESIPRQGRHHSVQSRISLRMTMIRASKA